MKTFKVRDFRQKQFFIMDDVYLNGYAKILGVSATAVYLSLCRHADKDQVAFPSQELIATEHGMGERTVRDKLTLLEEWSIIRAERGRKKDGTWLNNVYYLLDKSEWKQPPANIAAGDPPANSDTNHRQSTASIHRQPLPHKDTHINMKDTHIKEEDIAPAPKIPNRLQLLRSQEMAFLKEFPGLTSTELREQIDRCNTYMAMSSNSYTNPGLFLKGWLKRYMKEKKIKDGEQNVARKILDSLPVMSPEETARGLAKLAEIRKNMRVRRME